MKAEIDKLLEAIEDAYPDDEREKAICNAYPRLAAALREQRAEIEEAWRWVHAKHEEVEARGRTIASLRQRVRAAEGALAAQQLLLDKIVTPMAPADLVESCRETYSAWLAAKGVSDEAS